jgi:cellulose synthase/poly-beta-1,6-N-acetylglucosamine synthase-like glycosyltransferase
MAVFAIILLVLVVYHHVGYPLLLKLIARYKSKQQTSATAGSARGFKQGQHDESLPSIHIVVPAFNEEAVIQQKIDSMGWLDYPDNKLAISVYCDGCNDETVKRAIKGQSLFHNRDLDIRIINIEDNKGKVSIINRAIKECDADLIVFSDASAILSSDTLWRSAQHFISDPAVAVVTGDYSLLKTESDASAKSGTDGESAYWQYQNNVRNLESKLGAVMGVAGAYYAIRREFCGILEADTINDDFIMPMRAVELGGKAIFDAEIRILETEATPLEQDAQRRVRISQGNMQQLIRLKSLLLPGFDLNRFWVSWMFTSGKFLRVIMPYLLITLLTLSALLAFESYFFAFLFIGQVCAYGLAMMNKLVSSDGGFVGVGGAFNKSFNTLFNNKVARLVGYLCQGHLMGLIGSASYLLNTVSQHYKQRFLGITTEQRWHKVEINKTADK